MPSETDLWGSPMTMWPTVSDRLSSETDVAHQLFSKVDFKDRKDVCHDAPDYIQSSSLVAQKAYDVLNHAYDDTQATSSWWPDFQPGMLSFSVEPDILDQSPFWENLRSQNCFPYRLGPSLKSYLQCDSVEEHHSYMPEISPYIFSRVVVSQPSATNATQIAYDFNATPPWTSEHWIVNFQEPLLTENGSSRLMSLAPEDASNTPGSADHHAQQAPVHGSPPTKHLLSARNTVDSRSLLPEHHPWLNDNIHGSLHHQRRIKDKVLVELKHSGMSYSEIRARGHFKEAESTLRGRYRTLTKSKEHRVRKPQWHTKDVRLKCPPCVAPKHLIAEQIQLLRKAVLEFGVKPSSIRARQPRAGVDPASCTTKTSKISWKQVAEYIANHDGTYHFGNATCRKKWDEINGDLSLTPDHVG